LKITTLTFISLLSAAVFAEDGSRELIPLPRTAPVPIGNQTTTAKVKLGRLLFFDPRLSGDNEMSCASCHMPDKAFGDGLALSPGFGGMPLRRNTPTTLIGQRHFIGR